MKIKTHQNILYLEKFILQSKNKKVFSQKIGEISEELWETWIYGVVVGERWLVGEGEVRWLVLVGLKNSPSLEDPIFLFVFGSLSSQAGRLPYFVVNVVLINSCGVCSLDIVYQRLTGKTRSLCNCSVCDGVVSDQMNAKQDCCFSGHIQKVDFRNFL